MWLHRDVLQHLGFRRCSTGLWLCEGRYGLPRGAHLSLYSWGQDHRPVELTSFHVTFPLHRDVVHFYYREGYPNRWCPEGFTASGRIRALGGDPIVLMQVADEVAEALVARLGGTMGGRDPPALARLSQTCRNSSRPMRRPLQCQSTKLIGCCSEGQSRRARCVWRSFPWIGD